MNCRYCGSSNTIKYSCKDKIQYYECNSCNRIFACPTAFERKRFPEIILSETQILQFLRKLADHYSKRDEHGKVVVEGISTSSYVTKCTQFQQFLKSLPEQHLPTGFRSKVKDLI